MRVRLANVLGGYQKPARYDLSPQASRLQSSRSPIGASRVQIALGALYQRGRRLLALSNNDCPYLNRMSKINHSSQWPLLHPESYFRFPLPQQKTSSSARW